MFLQSSLVLELRSVQIWVCKALPLCNINFVYVLCYSINMNDRQVRTTVTWCAAFGIGYKSFCSTEHDICGVIIDFSDLSATTCKALVYIVITRVISALPSSYRGQRLVVIIASGADEDVIHLKYEKSI